ncbi:Sigma-70 region 2, partial [Streptomyces sp. SolWspMP-sol7th]
MRSSRCCCGCATATGSAPRTSCRRPFVRAWQHPEALRRADYASVRPWLFTVGRRLAIDARR